MAQLANLRGFAEEEDWAAKFHAYASQEES